jgi:hypothetical protein
MRPLPIQDFRFCLFAMKPLRAGECLAEVKEATGTGTGFGEDKTNHVVDREDEAEGQNQIEKGGEG